MSRIRLRSAFPARVSVRKSTLSHSRRRPRAAQSQRPDSVLRVHLPLQRDGTSSAEHTYQMARWPCYGYRDRRRSPGHSGRGSSMAISATLSQTSTPSRVSTGQTVWLSLVLLSALVFWAVIAFPYLIGTAEQMPLYETERGWIILHVALGTMALLTGPVQLWLGFTHRKMTLHRNLGKVYMVAVGLNALVALRLAATPSAGLVFGVGLAALAGVWLLTTGMAYVAIRRRHIAQHREWMIRSYVATFAFVFFRVIVGVMQAAGIGTLVEALGIAAWLCWSVPLVVTEAVLQSRKAVGPERAAA